MKRTLAAVGCLLLIAAVAHAEPKQNMLQFSTGTNTSGAFTNNISGYVEAIYVDVVTGVSSGTVTVSYAPLVGTNSINLATNAITAEAVWRPRVDSTTVGGVANTNDPPERFPLAGEPVAFNVTATATNLTWKCLIITNDQ